MTIEQMKIELIKVYPGRRWARRVNAMGESQVFALYNKFVANGKIKN